LCFFVRRFHFRIIPFLDIDYRGSDGYGRDFRTGIYRFMGGKDFQTKLMVKNTW
jgi:hypothetical protein